MTEDRRDTVVAVTGASGYIGTSLLQNLEEEGAQRKLVAIDINPLPFPIHNITVHRQDVTESIEDVLRRNRVTKMRCGWIMFPLAIIVMDSPKPRAWQHRDLSTLFTP